MNYKKKLLTTSIMVILFGTTQANDYITIITQEKHVYDVVENSLPVTTNWIDIGTEFSCIKEFNAFDYPLNQSFTQNENCLQKQERTVTTTEIFNGTPRTTVDNENRNIPVVISYLETGLENYDTGAQRTEYTNWLDNGVHYACETFAPLVSTVNLSQEFTQNRNCSQNQSRIETIYNIWADGSEILFSTNTEDQTLNEIETQQSIGTKNFVTGTQRTEYTNWLDNGIHYACDTFTPLVSTINLNESFTQNRDCSQDQTRTKTVYDIWADTSETVSITNIETQTLTESENQNAIGTKNFNTGTQRTEYTNWLNDGTHYACSVFSPLTNTIYSGESFEQNRSCSQNQTRTKTVYDIWADTSETISTTNIETQILTENETQNEVGTYLAASCKEIVDLGLKNGNKIYETSQGDTFCDMDYKDGTGFKRTHLFKPNQMLLGGCTSWTNTRAEWCSNFTDTLSFTLNKEAKAYMEFVTYNYSNVAHDCNTSIITVDDIDVLYNLTSPVQHSIDLSSKINGNKIMTIRFTHDGGNPGDNNMGVKEIYLYEQ